LRQYLVDAFARQPFRGGPACVVEPFAQWPDDAWMQAVGMENNQAETAFLRRTQTPGRFDLRWFTPTLEVKLCGHATLASAHVLFTELGETGEVLTFSTLSGDLMVRRADGRLEMDFPAYPPHDLPPIPELAKALGVTPKAVYGGPALIALLDTEAAVRAVAPDLKALPPYAEASVYNDRHVIVTAPADPDQPYDAVSRLFAPDMGIDEDPATGSMHCMLTPLYHRLTGRTVFDFYQAHPKRGAEIQAELDGNRVKLRGHAVTVARCELLL
jgi:PhzF family phenazine biosynthesis protein